MNRKDKGTSILKRPTMSSTNVNYKTRCEELERKVKSLESSERHSINQSIDSFMELLTVKEELKKASQTIAAMVERENHLLAKIDVLMNDQKSNVNYNALLSQLDNSQRINTQLRMENMAQKSELGRLRRRSLRSSLND